MVVYLDLDEDDLSDPEPHSPHAERFAGYERALRQRVSKPRGEVPLVDDVKSEREESISLNFNRLSTALGCYPYSHNESDSKGLLS